MLTPLSDPVRFRFADGTQFDPLSDAWLRDARIIRKTGCETQKLIDWAFEAPDIRVVVVKGAEDYARFAPDVFTLAAEFFFGPHGLGYPRYEFAFEDYENICKTWSGSTWTGPKPAAVVLRSPIEPLSLVTATLRQMAEETR